MIDALADREDAHPGVAPALLGHGADGGRGIVGHLRPRSCPSAIDGVRRADVGARAIAATCAAAVMNVPAEPARAPEGEM